MSEQEWEAFRQEPDVLVIDDVRTFDFPAVYARTVAEARTLLFSQPWQAVWWDYDMGDNETSPTTRELAQEVEIMAQNGQLLPVTAMVIHTANPDGRMAIAAALDGWYKVFHAEANGHLAPGEARRYYVGH